LLLAALSKPMPRYDLASEASLPLPGLKEDLDPGVVRKALNVSLGANGLLVFICIGLGAFRDDVASWLVLFGLPAVFVLAFANGANDCANSVGTIVGAGVLTMQQALWADAITELIGALTMGSFVAGTIAGGEVHVESFNEKPIVYSLMMLSIAIAAGATTLLSTFYGYPISATHAVISGIVAVALCSGVQDAVNWEGLGWTVLGWILSPLVGMLAGMAVAYAVQKLVMGTEDPASAAEARQPLLLSSTAYVSFLFLLLKGPRPLTNWIGSRYWLAILIPLPFAIFTGYIFTAPSVLHWLRSALDFIRSGRATSVLNPATEQSEFDDPYPSSSAESTQTEGLDETQRKFAPLLIGAGLTVAFAHGGNDVGNAVGPLAVMVDIARTKHVELSPALPSSALFFGAIAFVVGILLLGSRTISTVGSKITALTPSRSYCTQLGTAVAVLLSSFMELPVSTSHCLIGSMIGVSIVERYCGVADTDLDFSVLTKIVMGWALTIPLAAILAVLLFLPLKGILQI